MPKHPCPTCHKNEGIYDPQYGLLSCARCQKRQSKYRINRLPEFITLTKKDRIEKQRDEYGGDLEMPHGAGGKPNRKFAEINPDLVKTYYTKKEIRDMDL